MKKITYIMIPQEGEEDANTDVLILSSNTFDIRKNAQAKYKVESHYNFCHSQLFLHAKSI